jgi:hypothetical protein
MRPADPADHSRFLTSITRAAVGLALLTTTLVLAACGGEGDGDMRATLTDDGCTYEGDVTSAAGRFTIEVENETFQFAAFLLAALNEGSAFDDIEPFLERTRGSTSGVERWPTLTPPYETVGGAEVEPKSSTFLPVDVPAGRYVVLCVVHRSSDERRSADDVVPPERVQAAAQLDVTGSPSYP